MSDPILEPADLVRRFSFQELDARGCYVSLQNTVQDIQNTHHYPPALAKLLNEFAVSAVLLRDSVKLDGSLTIQYRSAAGSDGAVSMIIADCTHEYGVRAVCEFDSQRFMPTNDVIDLRELGNKATLTITISPKDGKRYQGVVAIDSASLSECLQDYFLRSEQLPSRFEILADVDKVVGMSIHALPEQDSEIVATLKDDWNRLNILLDTLTNEEFRELNSDTVLTRLFHEEQCLLHELKPVQFSCDCSRERSEGAIKSLGKLEIENIILEQGNVSIDCHFCFQSYEFNEQELKTLVEQV